LLRINKKTEYALMALQYLNAQPAGTLTNVREIAQTYGIPELLLAKILQDLRREEILTSTRGAAGGYSLLNELKSVGFLHFLQIFEQHTTVVQCASDDGHTCTKASSCMVKSPLMALNEVLTDHLSKLSIEDILKFDLKSDELTATSARP
jgi:Rrf2 family iron-sulfur cluster assembly transcriptional regulator